MSDKLAFESGPSGVSAHMFCGGEINLKLGLQTARESTGRLLWSGPRGLLRLDSICLLSDIVCFTPGNPLSSLTPFMVSGVYSDSSRSDPERPRGPGVHKPHVWNSKPFTITHSAIEFLPDRSLFLAILFELLYLLTFFFFFWNILWNYSVTGRVLRDGDLDCAEIWTVEEA